MIKIEQHYQSLLESGALSADPAQHLALNALTRLEQALVNHSPALGVYLHGPVGRGKTMLMDLFYDSLRIENKLRLHFHHFMAQVHTSLNALQGAENPLEQVAMQWAKKAKVICFDEFFVSDIGDAMIMARLFEALFAHDVVLVATSNCHPEQLYLNGLGRERFLPTIALLKSHCDVVSVAGDTDHRFAHGVKLAHFYFERDALMQRFKQSGGVLSYTDVTLCGREVSCLGRSEQGLLFDFFAICSSPRATADYMALAQQYDAVFIIDVMQMGGHHVQVDVVQGIEEGYQRAKPCLELKQYDDEARRFIALVDEFYDQKKLVVLSCEVALESLYIGEALAFEFERTKSRLVEMQHWKEPN